MTKKTEPTEIENAVAKMSLEEGAKLAKVSAKNVLAVNEYADRVHVITKDGKKIVVEK